MSGYEVIKGGLTALFQKIWIYLLLGGAIWLFWSKLAVLFGVKKTEYNLPEDYDFPASNIDTNQASAYAERLYNAMNGVGTNETEIINVFQAVNVNGALMVYNKFGSRLYVGTLDVPTPEFDLVGFLEHDLSHSEPAYLEAFNKLSLLYLM